MFVSSYSTYIDTATTKRVQNDKNDATKKSSTSFSESLSKEPSKALVTGKNLPVNYISNYKALHNRQQLQEREAEKSTPQLKFNKISTMGNAKVAYESNTTMFSLVLKPKTTLDQTPRVNKNFPKEAQKNQEDILKESMINTYVANDNYYRITAA